MNNELITGCGAWANGTCRLHRIVCCVYLEDVKFLSAVTRAALRAGRGTAFFRATRGNTLSLNT